MHKLLLSDLTFTTTKEFVRTRGKLFELIFISCHCHLQLSSAECHYISSKPPIFFFLDISVMPFSSRKGKESERNVK